MEDLLEVFAGLTRPDDVFALLEDLFTVREIKDTSQRLDVAAYAAKGQLIRCYRKGNRRLCDNHRPRIEGVELRCRRIWFGIWRCLMPKEPKTGKPLNRKTPQPKAKTKRRAAPMLPREAAKARLLY